MSGRRTKAVGLEKDRVMNTMQYELKQIPKVPADTDVVDLSIVNPILGEDGTVEDRVLDRLFGAGRA